MSLKTRDFLRNFQMMKMQRSYWPTNRSISCRETITMSGPSNDIIYIFYYIAYVQHW